MRSSNVDVIVVFVNSVTIVPMDEHNVFGIKNRNCYKCIIVYSNSTIHRLECVGIECVLCRSEEQPSAFELSKSNKIRRGDELLEQLTNLII